MKRLLVLAFALALGGCAAARPETELVETTPVETKLDHADIPDAYLVWASMIDSARRTIDLEQFYVAHEPGKRLTRIVSSLQRAIARGVKIRLLVDSSLTQTYADSIVYVKSLGVDVRVLAWNRAHGGIQHAKFFIVDGESAYLGSQNLDWRSLSHIVELGARVDDPGVISRLAAIFAADWELATNEHAHPTWLAPASPTIELVASPKDALPPGIAWELPALVSMIENAKQSIRVQLLSYLAGDWDELERPLVAAVARGVRVELLVADWTKRENTIGGLQRLAEKGVEIKLVTIPRAHDGFIPFARVTHAKLLVVDNSVAWIGTSNWEREYFYQSRNVGLILRDPTLAARVQGFSDTLWSSAYATVIDPHATYTTPRIE